MCRLPAAVEQPPLVPAAGRARVLVAPLNSSLTPNPYGLWREAPQDLNRGCCLLLFAKPAAGPAESRPRPRPGSWGDRFLGEPAGAPAPGG